MIAVKIAIQLIGNANAKISHLRRKKVTSSFNKGLLPLQICKSPLVLNKSNIVTCSNPISSDCIGSTCLESPAMVSSPSGDDNGISQIDTRQSGSTRSTPIKAVASTSRMAYLQERYTSEHLSEEATSLMLKSWRSKTNKSYDSFFGRWNTDGVVNGVQISFLAL